MYASVFVLFIVTAKPRNSEKVGKVVIYYIYVLASCTLVIHKIPLYMSLFYEVFMNLMVDVFHKFIMIINTR